jgi:branched-subunit amino acid ABC-type transport system permease component
MPQLLELFVNGIAVGCIYSLIGLGFTMIIRSTGILNFAQGEMVMLGAMFGLSALAFFPLPFPAVLLIGMVGAGAASVFIELVVYRTMRVRRVPLINVIIATVGMSLVVQNVSQLVWGSEPIAYPSLSGRGAYTFGSIKLSPQIVWIIALAFSLMVLLQLFLRFTRAGLAMEATAQDPEAAQLMGINLTRSIACTFGIAGMMAGAAGVLMGSLFFASFNMGFLPGLKAFIAATLGGLGSIGGAIVGGIILGLLETFGAVWISSSYRDAIGMVILIVILLIVPQGLVGLLRSNRGLLR